MAFYDEFLRHRRDLETGFHRFVAGESIYVSHPDTSGFPVSLFFHEGEKLEAWLLKLHHYSRPEMREIWRALTSCAADYDDSQVELLDYFRRALRRRGLAVELPQDLYGRYVGICAARYDSASEIDSMGPELSFKHGG